MTPCQQRTSSQPARVAAFRKRITLVAAPARDVMVSVHPEFSKLAEKIERHAWRPARRVHLQQVCGAIERAGVAATDAGTAASNAGGIGPSPLRASGHSGALDW